MSVPPAQGLQQDHDHGVAARVGARVITIDAVAAREQALRNGPFAGRLPHSASPQGRNVGRWLVQLMAAEELIVQEAADRGFGTGTVASERTGSRTHGYTADAVSLGGVAATALATIGCARRVRDAVTAEVDVTEGAVHEHYERNRDRFAVPATISLDAIDTCGPRRWAQVAEGELPPSWERLLLAAPIGSPVEVAPGRTFAVREIVPASCQPFAEVREGLHRELRDLARDVAFAEWLHRRACDTVILSHGFEHPGDPRQPDVTHRH